MRKPNYIVQAVVLLCTLVSGLSIFADGSAPLKKVLIFSSEEIHLPGLAITYDAIRSTLNDDQSSRFTFFYEAQDSARIPNEKYEAEYVDFLRRKYAGEKIDIIFVRSPPGIRFLQKHEAEIFTGVPKVFITNNQRELEGLDLGGDFTGVSAKIEFGPTLDLILEQRPVTKRVVVVTGSANQDAVYRDQARNDLSRYEGRVQIDYLSSLTIPDLQKELSSLPPDNVCLFISYQRDPDGNGYSIPEVISTMVPSASVPIYALADSAIGSGAVGGKMLSFQLMGERAGEIGRQILAGQKPSEIPVQTVESVPMFDWRQLRRWNISNRLLPAGSIVRYKEPTAWERYKWPIVGIITFSIFQTLLIGWLLFVRARRKTAESESLSFAALAKAEHQKLDEVVANVPGIVWESRMGSGLDDRRIEFVSDYAEKMLGYTPEEITSIPNFWRSVVLEEDQVELDEALRDIFSGRDKGAVQFRCRAKDGSFIWAEANLIATYDEDGGLVGLRGVAIDITDRKFAEEELYFRELELKEAQRLAQIGNWEWDPEPDTVRWSEQLYQIAGLDPSMPAPNFDEHRNHYSPESYERLVTAVETALATGTPYELELEMIRSDNQRVWVKGRGEAILDEHNKVRKLRGTLQDMSDQKRTEGALQMALDEVSKLQAELQEENTYLKEVIKLEHNFDEIIGVSDSLKYVLIKIEQVAKTDATVLITGETGTGKELVARALHRTSPRKNMPLVMVNCAALSAGLIESELFGHERGAFTDASVRKIGRFELANGATIFLDEVGELPIELQPKLLRVIQEGEFERLGSSKTIKVDVRIISATNRDLEAEVRKGTFREDLLFRLKVFPITVPPLRERKDDIPLLIEHFTQRFSKKLGKNIRKVSPATVRSLSSYFWPGNIRELANVIERSVINAQGEKLQISETFGMSSETPSSPLAQTLETMERNYITQILVETGWKIEGWNGAARILGLNPSTLRTRLSKLGISRHHDQATAMDTNI